MYKTPSVSFIGAGNLAWHLAPALDNTDFAVREVYSRKARHAAELVDKLYQAEVKDSLDFSSSPSRIFVIAVPDDAIEEIVQEVILPDKSLLVHTSGSQPLDILKDGDASYTGVFYPLQTFTKGKKIDFREVPIFIESKNSDAEKILGEMGKALSKNVRKINSKTRQSLHIGAVFASNFVNHMLTLSKDILKSGKLEFDLLKPLIAETVNKALSLDPEKAQTGPARRGDMEVLDRHMEFLEEQYDEDVAEIYKIITQHIIDWYDVE